MGTTLTAPEHQDIDLANARHGVGGTDRSDYLHRFQRQQGLIEWDAAELAECRIPAEVAQILHIATFLEEDTAITLRQGVAFGLDRRADLAAFLPQWGAEEAEHARALHVLLAHQDYEHPERIPAAESRRRRHLLARLPVHTIGRAREVGFLFCTMGAAAEYVATMLYADLAKRCDAPPVTDLLRAIARQEARHLAFFLAGARAQGEQMSRVHGQVSRIALRALWEPIGMPTLGRDLWIAMFGEWLHDEHLRARLEKMDRVVDSVPHLEGVRLMGTFLESVSATN